MTSSGYPFGIGQGANVTSNLLVGEAGYRANIA